MEHEQVIRNLWTGHWKDNMPEATEPIRSRYAIEAFRKIRTFVDDNDRLILDAGCGTGRFAALLAKEHPNATVVGIDISPSGLEIARKLVVALGCQNVTFKEGSVFQLPFDTGYFDVVHSEGLITLFSLEDPLTYVDALRELIRVTKPGGKVLVAGPNWYCFPHTLYKWALKLRNKPYMYGFEKSFTHKELLSLCHAHGLDQIQFSGYYPAHAFYRHAGRNRFFHLAGVATDKLERACDRIRRDWFSRLFGFVVMVKGVKNLPPSVPSNATT